MIHINKLKKKIVMHNSSLVKDLLAVNLASQFCVINNKYLILKDLVYIKFKVPLVFFKFGF